jgi:hypothetical protein
MLGVGAPLVQYPSNLIEKGKSWTEYMDELTKTAGTQPES